MVFIYVFFMFCCFFPLDGRLIFFEPGASLHLYIHIYFMFFLSGLSIHLSGLARPCEPVRSWMNLAFLETTLGQRKFANASCCLWDNDIVIVFYGLGCDLIQSDIGRLHLDQSSAYIIDRCLIDVTMAYCCPSFLAFSIRWLKTPT